MRKDDDKSLWFVIRDGGADRRLRALRGGRHGGGFVGMIGTRKAWRRRDSASRCCCTPFASSGRRGIRRVTLGVDSENATGATRLYERAGMHVESEHVTFEKELGVISLRPPTLEDLPALTAFFGQLERTGGRGEGEAEIRHLLTTPLFDVEADFRIALEGGQIVGWCDVSGPEQGARATLSSTLARAVTLPTSTRAARLGLARAESPGR